VALRGPIARSLGIALGVALGGLIGLSRLVLGAHWPTDVLAGWALGTAVAVAVVTALALIVRLDGGSQDRGDRSGRWQSGLRFLASNRG
jgi:membrane-associated phospholipid phosphatase